MILSRFQVLGVDFVPQAIADAKENAKRNRIDNTKFFSGKLKLLKKCFVLACDLKSFLRTFN